MCLRVCGAVGRRVRRVVHTTVFFSIHVVTRCDSFGHCWDAMENDSLEWPCLLCSFSSSSWLISYLFALILAYLNLPGVYLQLSHVVRVAVRLCLASICFGQQKLNWNWNWTRAEPHTCCRRQRDIPWAHKDTKMGTWVTSYWTLITFRMPNTFRAHLLLFFCF